MKNTTSFRNPMDWRAFKETLAWAIADKKHEIAGIVKGYTDQWKIDHWDEWKVIRARYYQERQKMYQQFSCYPKSIISSAFANAGTPLDYNMISDEMVNNQIKILKLRDYVEETKYPAQTGKVSRSQRRWAGTDKKRG